MCPFYTYNDHSFVFKYILHTSYVLQRVGHDWSSLAHTVKQCNQKYFIYENNEYMPVSLVYHCFMDNNISEVKKKFVKIWAYMLCRSLSKINTLEKIIILFTFPDYVPPCWVIFSWFISSLFPQKIAECYYPYISMVWGIVIITRMDETVFSYQKSKGYDVYGS